MFGSCGNNLKCGIGEIAISKITIVRTQKEIAYYTRPSDVESSIDLTDVRLLRGISFSQRRDLNYISYDRRSSIVTGGEQFSPERLSLQINYLSDVETVKRFLRDKNSKYVMRLEFPHKVLFCEVILEEDTVDTYTILDRWNISFLRTSMYYTIIPYTLDINARATITNRGDVPGAIQFDYWETLPVDPTKYMTIKFFWENATTVQREPFNMFSMKAIYVVPWDEDLFSYSSVPGDMYMYLNPGGGGTVEDLSGFRDFATKGFVEVPHGISIIEFGHFNTYGPVNVYEYYYNI